jgi:hypothetical protein
MLDHLPVYCPYHRCSRVLRHGVDYVLQEQWEKEQKARSSSCVARACDGFLALWIPPNQRIVESFGVRHFHKYLQELSIIDWVSDMFLCSFGETGWVSSSWNDHSLLHSKCWWKYAITFCYTWFCYHTLLGIKSRLFMRQQTLFLAIVSREITNRNPQLRVCRLDNFRVCLWFDEWHNYFAYCHRCSRDDSLSPTTFCCLSLQAIELLDSKNKHHTLIQRERVEIQLEVWVFQATVIWTAHQEI